MGLRQDIFIIDFDSTFTQVEAMEELAAISLKNDPDKEILINQIKELTNLAMEGKMPFDKSLVARIALLSAKKYHLKMLVNRLRQKITPSFASNKNFLKTHCKNIYIVSGGFKEFIYPVVKPYGILENQVYANNFVYDSKNNIIGADANNPLSKEKGKVLLMKQLKLKGNIHVIGDGFTDYEIKEAGLADYFYAFTENIARESVVSKAQIVAPSLDEILFSLKLPMAVSYPKSRLNALLWGEKTALILPFLKKEGYTVVSIPLNTSLKAIEEALDQTKILIYDPNNLIGKINPIKIKNLSVVATWDKVKNEKFIQKLTSIGIPHFEPIYAHTRSVAELALMFLLQLARKKGQELLGKKLSIIGYGHSGSLLSIFAENLGMDVFYYDSQSRPPIGKAKKINTLHEVLKKGDYIVLLDENQVGDQPILKSKELSLIGSKASLINLSSYQSVDFVAISKALIDTRISGYAADCVNESDFDEAQLLPNTMVSLNERANTSQTQENIATYLSEHIINYINTGNSEGSSNFPNLTLPQLTDSHRFIHIHQNKPGVLANINSLLAQFKINITGQYLKTNFHIGYVITDVSKTYPDELINALKKIENTLKFRVLY